MYKNRGGGGVVSVVVIIGRIVPVVEKHLVFCLGTENRIATGVGRAAGKLNSKFPKLYAGCGRGTHVE